MLPGLWLQAQMTGQSACSVVLLDQSEASAALVARTGGASDRALISHGAADPSYQAGTREGPAGGDHARHVIGYTLDPSFLESNFT